MGGRRRLWAVAALALAAASCSEGRQAQPAQVLGVQLSQPVTTTRAPAAPETSSGVAIGTPPTYGGLVGDASAAACAADLMAVQQASNIYTATHGNPAPSMDAIVADGHLPSPPSGGNGYVIAYDAATGRVSASGACSTP